MANALPGLFLRDQGTVQGAVSVSVSDPDCIEASQVFLGECVSTGGTTLVNFSGKFAQGRGGKLFLPACQYTRATIMLRLFS